MTHVNLNPKECTIDPGFPAFNDYCRENKFPVTIISSGLLPLLSKIMTNFLGDKAKDIEIVANNGKVEGRDWKIIWRDDSIYGNDKSKSKCGMCAEMPSWSLTCLCSSGQGS